MNINGSEKATCILEMMINLSKKQKFKCERLANITYMTVHAPINQILTT